MYFLLLWQHKNQNMRTCCLYAFLFLTFSLFAQPYNGVQKIKTEISKGAGCSPPTTTTYLETNNVRAMIHTAGNLWQVPGQNYSRYEVPKNSGIQALFTSALWLGGTDFNNQLKLAAMRYRNGQDYWTGPLTKVSAETSADNCLKYDQHFITTQDMIREFDAWYNAGISDKNQGTNIQNTLYPNYKVPNGISEWPAHGDVSLGQDYYLAPFFDRNEDGNYNWEDGDYPWHDINKTKECTTDRRVSLYGDLNYWWVMNDKGNIHTETGGEPIGMEIRAQAFSFSSNDEINNMTFYNYELINRGTQTLYDTYFGFFTDGALGDPYDDYVGCDVNRGLAYYYNGDNYDGDNSGFKGYGDNPPAVGVDFFEGPYQDNDGIDNAFGIGQKEALNGIGYGDGVIDNERFGMRRFLYYSNNTNGANPSQTDPSSAGDYYNYLKGYWKDGTKFYYGGNGHVSDNKANPEVPCDFMFPGDTDPLGWGTGGKPQPVWTEQLAGNTPNDRRFVQSAGPFVLTPGSVNNITVGVSWARSTSGDPFSSVEVLRRADDKAQALFENCFKVLEGPHAPDLAIQELENELILTLTNPISSNNYQEKYSEFDPFIVTDVINPDKHYRFQGYQIYQLATNTVSTSDLDNPNKARLVAQCDIKDGVKKLINFEFDEYLEASYPVLKVEGEDIGIKHSFKVTADLFAKENRTLVNFKKYHYMAISYAYNNYKNYSPTDPNALDGQKRVYLQSRKAAIGEVKLVEAIPHNPLPENGGTKFILDYGETPEITRLDGYGNGNRSLDLTESTISEIVQNGFATNLVYKKGSGPIHVKVIDPLNVADGYFECSFNNYKATSSNGADTASWVIYRYSPIDGKCIDSIKSELTLAQNNEQLIPQWGISVQLHQEKYYYPTASEADFLKFTDPIESTINFSDSSKRWLSFISDSDGYFPMNWIRSGNSDDDATGANPSWTSPSCYVDEKGIDPKKHYSKLLGGGIAPHRLTGYQCDYMPLAYYKLPSPEIPRNNAVISFLPSVDIVITSDKSNWTKCAVIELGRDANLTVGGAQAGSLRKSPSVNKQGKPDGTSTTGMSWFPGYAIDCESGARLCMAFGENSFLGIDGGSDMIWNPSARLFDEIGNPVLGGLQPIYIFSYNQKTINNYSSGFDFPAYKESDNFVYQKMLEVEANNATAKKQFYGSLTWILQPLLIDGQINLASDVTIRVRVNKEYKNFSASGKNNGKPMYSWNMEGLQTERNSKAALAEALKLIRVVPNPYNAFSAYELNKLDNRVKLTNLPHQCTIRIYSVNGKLIKQIKKDNPSTSQDWNLQNHAQIPVASGIYIIHIEVPEVGEISLKAMITMRQPDIENL
jgi:hypothetical protein